MKVLLRALAGTATGMAVGGIATHQLFHWREAAAFTLKATTMAERLGSVSVAVMLFVLLAYVAFHFFSRSFFHGFIAAAGLILSSDIVLLHWIFQLHRITSGPEADILEPLFVLCGVALTSMGSNANWPRASTSEHGSTNVHRRGCQ